jgi:hypothetical protein
LKTDGVSVVLLAPAPALATAPALPCSCLCTNNWYESPHTLLECEFDWLGGVLGYWRVDFTDAHAVRGSGRKLARAQLSWLCLADADVLAQLDELVVEIGRIQHLQTGERRVLLVLALDATDDDGLYIVIQAQLHHRHHARVNPRAGACLIPSLCFLLRA